MDKGFLQIEGVDFFKTFFTRVNPTIIRVILTFAVSKGWALRQIDVNNAFLNSNLTGDVYSS